MKSKVIDLHCHILPGLDDGPGSLDVALEMVQIALADGIDTIIASPHMLNGTYNVTSEHIYKGIEGLCEEVRKRGLAITLLPGADVHVDKTLPRLIAEGKVVTLAGRGKHLMVELPQDVFPPEIDDLLFQIQLRGVTPILSHPERNIEIQQNPALLRRFIHTGNLTQVTAGSLTGAFGLRIQELSLKLLRSKMVHLVATDGHSPNKRPPRLAQARALVEAEMGVEETRAIFDQRPAMLLQGLYVEPPDPFYKQETSRQRFWHRFLRVH